MKHKKTHTLVRLLCLALLLLAFGACGVGEESTEYEIKSLEELAEPLGVDADAEDAAAAAADTSANAAAATDDAAATAAAPATDDAATTDAAAADAAADAAATDDATANASADAATTTDAADATDTGASSAADATSDIDAAARAILEAMSLEDKIAQMFIITQDALTGTSGSTVAGAKTVAAYEASPVGGIIYMKANLTSATQTKALLSAMQDIALARTGLPLFLSVDEEGGTVARIGNNDGFDIENVGNMSAIGATGDATNAYNVGVTIGTYLKDLGFNLDYAPVADVLTNPDNPVIGVRSFGSDAGLVAEMVCAELSGLESAGVYGVVKHFPGHGDTATDSHSGMAVSERTMEQLKAEELLPFAAAIEAGVSFLMVGHISLPNILEDNTPASLSYAIVTELLREEMGYEGIIMTDALDMSAITDAYTDAEAAVAAVEAGVDILLMPADYEKAYRGLLEAVLEGGISEARIDASVLRIIKVKLEMNG